MVYSLGMTRVLTLILIFIAASVSAAPESYTLVPKGSEISFTYSLSGAPTKGKMGVGKTQMVLDFEDVSRSKVDVTLDLSKARAGLVFATDAMRSGTVLNVAEFPKARFVSTSVRRTSTGARLAGNLTLRGVTRPFELDARIFRARGSDPEDLSELSIVLTGRMNRNNFGATGYPDLVGPNVDLRITARVIRN